MRHGCHERTVVPPPDADNDGVPDASDNCPAVPNPGQANNDGDSQGDVCDPDDDNDTVADGPDNCPTAANAGQADSDSDGIGDACDPTPLPPVSPSATPQCGDGVDNDNDGAIDRQDPGCLSATSDVFSRADTNEGDENLRQLTLCGQSNVKLVRADAKGSRVLLSGFVGTRFAGGSVAIRVTIGGKSKGLASVKPSADGRFNATVKGPGKRAFTKARYQAVVAGSGSTKLKLPQSLTSKSLRKRGARSSCAGRSSARCSASATR